MDRMCAYVPQADFHFDKCMSADPVGFTTTSHSLSLGGVSDDNLNLFVPILLCSGTVIFCPRNLGLQVAGVD